MAEVVIVADAVEAGEIAATEIEHLLRAKPDAVLGFATGSTPLTTWTALANKNLDLSTVTGFALDEYVGLASEHPESYRSVIEREVVVPLGLDVSRVHVPTYRPPVETAGQYFEDAIHAAGGIDLQVLGIGSTGHIGFNEPGSSLMSETRVKALAAQTRIDNARFFGSLDDVPTHCITQGLGTILRAHRLVLLAFGEAKAEVVAQAIEGPITASLPASVIQLHPRAMVIIDEPAAARLANADYYRAAWASRLGWEES